MAQNQILFGILLLIILYFLFIKNKENLDNVQPIPTLLSSSSLGISTTPSATTAVKAIQTLANTALRPTAASPSTVTPLANTAIAPMTSQSGVGAIQQLEQQALSHAAASPNQVSNAVNIAVNAITTPAPMFIPVTSMTVTQSPTPFAVQNSIPVPSPISTPVPPAVISSVVSATPVPAPQTTTSLTPAATLAIQQDQLHSIF